MAETNPDCDPFEMLAEEFTRKCRSGDSPSVEDYAVRYPALAGDIRELFPTIQAVENAKHHGGGSSSRQLLTHESPVGRLGDFRIVRELGHGGMGVVYEAEQESLGRRVAIKVLPRRHTEDPARRERFDREARTAARLHHTNIVPVFGVGEQDGYHYLVMQYIRGVGLDTVFKALAGHDAGAESASSSTLALSSRSSDLIEVARDLLEQREERAAPVCHARTSGEPLSGNAGGSRLTLNRQYWRHLARVMAQAADAVAYAHSQSVLHRDLKPSNLLLDSDGTLWVADFGLAKEIGHEGATQTGDLVGTLRYMAPEQIEGRIEARSDVYSLGVTLYELATLRPAFAEAKTSSLIRAIMEKPLPPARQVCPGLPRDLETIILKASARAIEHRYGSAAELRDDLLGFVEDRPIRARRISRVERLRRWAMRNPLPATLGLASLALLLTVAIVSFTAYVSVRIANSRAELALAGERRQRQRVEAVADLSLQAMEATFDRFAPESLLSAQELSVDGTEEYTVSVAAPAAISPETATFLEQMLVFYRKLGQQEGESLSVQLKVAAAHHRVGEIHERLGRYADAEAAYDVAIRRCEAMCQSDPNNTAARTLLARVHNKLAAVLFTQEKAEPAGRHLQESRELLRALNSGPEPAPEARFELARALYLSAMIPSSLSSKSSSGPAERPAGLHPQDGASPRPDIGSYRDWRDRFRAWNQRRIACLREAVQILTDLTGQMPRVSEYRHLLARCLREQRGPGFDGDRGSGHPGSLDRAIEILEKLPQLPPYRFDLAETYAMQDRGPQARARVLKAIAIMEDLVREQPHVPDYTLSLANMYIKLSGIDKFERREEEALKDMRQSGMLYQTLAHRFPDSAKYVLPATFQTLMLADTLRERTEFKEARIILEGAVLQLERLTAAGVTGWNVRGALSAHYAMLADVYRGLKESALEEATRSKLTALRRGH
ncbi:MAG: serine/threonine protein kinase [Phycisphaerae bacterium]|nr:serine/threonine protein kinase [Phycisphaerae bacterium]